MAAHTLGCRHVVVDIHLVALLQQLVGIVGEDGVLIVDELADVGHGEPDGHGAVVAVDNVAAVLGVEFLQLVHGNAQHAGHLLKVYVAVDHDGVGLGRQLREHGADVVVAVVVHDVVGGNEGRHVALGLGGQVGVDLPVVAHSSGSVYGAVHLVGAAVVGGDDQVPVVEYLVEVAQILGGGVGAFQRVAALVDQRVDRQAVVLARGDHKLPQAGCPHARHGPRIEGRLDDGQVFQLKRQPVALKSLLEDGHIEVLRAQHVGNGMAQVAAVAVDHLLHHSTALTITGGSYRLREHRRQALNKGLLPKDNRPQS